ncbi:hypothetical protein EUGRSUZ_L01868 [Eucalyptus grandis]|uniref:Uncharacterized protein n=1 Tax=Eucalyptus grandis TaxID=71139 RepID=A0A058ZTD0_EUCGR|nr:hypothetical protein EUGRSUZ_L01868 [Eucalyptus grandis]
MKSPNLLTLYQLCRKSFNTIWRAKGGNKTVLRKIFFILLFLKLCQKEEYPFKYKERRFTWFYHPRENV